MTSRLRGILILGLLTTCVGCASVSGHSPSAELQFLYRLVQPHDTHTELKWNDGDWIFYDATRSQTPDGTPLCVVTVLPVVEGVRPLMILPSNDPHISYGDKWLPQPVVEELLRQGRCAR